MTKLVIFNAQEKRQFDSPPPLTDEARIIYFSLSDELLKIIVPIRTPTNKVGFILQYGYFKATSKFFTANQFKHADIEFICKQLAISLQEINLLKYQKRILTYHRAKILALLGWQPFDKKQAKQLQQEIMWYAARHQRPKTILLDVLSQLQQRKVEIPSYNLLAFLITEAYNKTEQALLNTLKNNLTELSGNQLDALAFGDAKHKAKMARPPITLIKRINQSLQPADIQASIKDFLVFKTHYANYQAIIAKLDLAQSSIEYYADWVQKAQAYQIRTFSDKARIYLHLLAYIQHQYYLRQDSLVDILLKSVQSTKNTAIKQLQALEHANRREKNKAIRQLTQASRDSRLLVEEITTIVKDENLVPFDKVQQIEILLDDYHQQHDQKEQTTISVLEQSLDKSTSQQAYFDSLEKLSLKLQRRIADIIKVLTFNPATSNAALIKAIHYFQQHNGNINFSAPDLFLTPEEQIALYKEDDQFRPSLYKVLLFIHIADAIKSGELNLLYTYRYNAIQDYLINQETWQQQRDELLDAAGLTQFADCKATINQLKQRLNSQYDKVNHHFSNNENPFLSFNSEGNLIVSTPKTERTEDNGFIASLLTQKGYVPIVQVLYDIEQATQFTSCFKHFSIKHQKMKIKPDVVLAGIMGKGCNIGINKMAALSMGILEDKLKNTVNWCFSLNNIQAANNKIMYLINKLALANMFRHQKHQLHTASDGRKVNVAVDSLHANYSFKYHGRDKGVSIYTFIDERQMLFHSTVISSSEREAAYVMDGLMRNDVIKSTIHSTDTHGFTETVFAATHLLDIAFAPRFKQVGKQRIYSFCNKQRYIKKGHKILPSRSINQKLLEKQWDDILRFMATIKLKETTASQLFKRLSSYAKDHPLYKALKEFGRIIKSLFILAYFDEIELRQRIEKQLNRIELANKFSKAVFFANNQEFMQGTKEEQEITTACKVLIQNAIVLWNYLYLSQLLANNANLTERNNMVKMIQHGSVMTWRHVNLLGKYDFSRPAANNAFDLDKILALDLAA
jgi:TnpA family transposase